MGEQIEDGSGAGFSVKVDKKLRLHTLSTVKPIEETSTEDGNSYHLTSGDINLTGNNTTSAVFYIKNNEDDNVNIRSLIVFIGNSTSGAGDLQIEVLKNPTAGTIIGTGTDVDAVANKNFGSGSSLEVDAFQGVEAATFTDGTRLTLNIYGSPVGEHELFENDVILSKGSSIGVRVTTQASNTSMDINVNADAYIINGS